MATYTIVDKDKDPLDPGEINSGETIDVSDGDIFIIDASADDDITFEALGGGPADFEIVVNDSNANDFKITIKSDLTPSITVADNADLGDIDIDAKDADAVTMILGDGVSLGKYDGSTNGADIIDIGDDFTTTTDWKTGGGADQLTYGENADIKKVDMGDGNDTLRFGDNSTVTDVKMGKGDDVMFVGDNVTANSLDGGNGNDTLNTQTTGTSTSNFEGTNVVCFVRGTLIATPKGDVPVETLRVGRPVCTLDHGHRMVRWIGSFRVDSKTLLREPRLRPICISAGALGSGFPKRELRLSPNHRIMLRSKIAERMFGVAEVLVAAKKLLPLAGIDVIDDCRPVEYFHFLLDRHEVVLSEGAATESMFLGAQTLTTVEPDSTLEIRAAISFVGGSWTEGDLARLAPWRGRLVKNLITRHRLNGKTLFDGAELSLSRWGAKPERQPTMVN